MKNYVKEYKGYKVPEGATHWLNNGFAKWFDNKSISVIGYFQGATWKKCYCGMPQNAIELPEAKQERKGKEWEGKGLPPAGTECEISYDGRPWKKCFINYSSESIVVFTNELGAELVYSTKGIARFRPVTTQEQKDREAFIDNCLKATAGNEPYKVFHDLYDAGARFK